MNSLEVEVEHKAADNALSNKILTNSRLNSIDVLKESPSDPLKLVLSSAALPKLPSVDDILHGSKDALDKIKRSVKNIFDPQSEQKLDNKYANEQLYNPELETPINEVTRKALVRDADQYPPVRNEAEKSTTYTVIQPGITNRQSEENGASYYSREVSVTVPDQATNLKQCKFDFAARRTIGEDEYNQLLQKDLSKAGSIIMNSHGVFTSEKLTDSEGVLLNLSSGLPTVEIDWTAHAVDRKDTLQMLYHYEKDSLSARTASHNREFVDAIDKTIEKVGADKVNMIGFSHGAMFDAFYLAHRVENNMPALKSLILAHPDVPIGAPELMPDGKADLLRDASIRSYVIGGKADLELKSSKIVGWIPGPSFLDGHPSERLGDDSAESRKLIEAEGAQPISELDRKHSETNHFLNYAGIAQLLRSESLSTLQVQGEYDRKSNLARRS